jgi:hypothetical protein
VVLWCLLACADPKTDSAAPAPDRVVEPLPLDDTLRMNHLQLKGTHNSTHIEPDTVFDDSHRYTHPSITDQLDLWGVRQLELDLHWHLEDGLRTHHLTGIDERSTCPLFADCLDELADWSDTHPQHAPILVYLEFKDDDVDLISPDYGDLVDRWPDIEAAITTALGRDRVLTPDDLRRGHPTLPEALAADGWPTLAEARGQVVFSILDANHHRDAYLVDAPALEGRLMFVRSDSPEDAFAAYFKDGSAESTLALTEAGFVTTSNVDGADQDPETLDAGWAAMGAAGLHHLATDHAWPGATASGRWLDLRPGCNPVTAPAECTPELVDPY